MTHGTGGYALGCKCDVCRGATAAYRRRKRTEARGGLPPAWPKYGPEDICPGPECTRRMVLNGMCEGHNRQVKQGRPLAALKVYKPRGSQTECRLTHCPRGARYDGLCNTHYERRRLGRPDWDVPVPLRQRRAARSSQEVTG